MKCHILRLSSGSALFPKIKPPRGTLIFSYIRRLGPFLGFKNLNFNIFGGMKILGVITKLDCFRGHFY